MNHEVKSTLLELKDLQEKEAQYKSRLSATKKKHQDEINLLNKSSDIDNIKVKIDLLKGEIENWALDEFKKTKEKKLDGGIGIQEYTVLTYDEKEAYNWAKDKNLCLALDKKKFEKTAKANPDDFDFVKLEKIPKVTFPTKGITLKG